MAIRSPERLTPRHMRASDNAMHVPEIHVGNAQMKFDARNHTKPHARNHTKPHESHARNQTNHRTKIARIASSTRKESTRNCTKLHELFHSITPTNVTNNVTKLHETARNCPSSLSACLTTREGRKKKKTKRKTNCARC